MKKSARPRRPCRGTPRGEEVIAAEARPPRILAFDTSTPVFTAAFFGPGRAGKGRVSEINLESSLRHSDVMFTALRRLLAGRRAEFRDVDLFAVGTGPGSFTGLRVGVTAAKTLAHALAKPLVGISSLETVAANYRAADGLVWVVADAGRTNLYAACFEGGKMSVSPRIEGAERFLGGLCPGSRFAGSALSSWGERIARTCGRQALLPRAGWRPRAANMIALALARWARTDFDDPLKLVPEYLYEKTVNARKNP